MQRRLRLFYLCPVDRQHGDGPKHEKVLSFGIAWPYVKPVYVLTSDPSTVAVPEVLLDKVQKTDREPVALMQDLRQKGMKRVYIDGGATIRSFLNEDLISEMIITTIPILLGTGISLFGPMKGDKDLHFSAVRSRLYPHGLVQTTYHRS